MNLFYCVFLLIHLVSCSEVKNDDGLKKINDINSKENTIRFINPKDSISKPTSFGRIATDEKQLKVDDLERLNSKGQNITALNDESKNKLSSMENHSNQRITNQLNRNIRSKKHSNRKHRNKKHGNKKHSNRKHRNKKHDNKKHSNRKHRNKKHGNKKHCNRKHRNRNHRNRKHPNKKQNKTTTCKCGIMYMNGTMTRDDNIKRLSNCSEDFTCESKINGRCNTKYIYRDNFPMYIRFVCAYEQYLGDFNVGNVCSSNKAYYNTPRLNFRCCKGDMCNNISVSDDNFKKNTKKVFTKINSKRLVYDAISDSYHEPINMTLAFDIIDNQRSYTPPLPSVLPLTYWDKKEGPLAPEKAPEKFSNKNEKNTTTCKCGNMYLDGTMTMRNFPKEPGCTSNWTCETDGQCLTKYKEQGHGLYMQFSCQEKSWPKCPTDSDVQVNSWGAQELHCCKGEMCNDVIVTDASYKQKMLEVCSRFDEKEASFNGRGLNCNEVENYLDQLMENTEST